MPTEAVTGTRQLKTVVGDDKVKARGRPRKDKRTDSEREADENAATARAAMASPPLADPSGNGTIQVTAPDGSTTNIDAAQEGWEDEVRALNPKHQSIR